MNKFWYLATVYSKHPDGIEAAFQMAAKAAAKLIQKGYKIYSPIAHTHPIAIHGNMDAYDHDIWLKLDETFMEAAEGIIVLKTDGWLESKGINFEINYFKSKNKPIRILDPKELD